MGGTNWYVITVAGGDPIGPLAETQVVSMIKSGQDVAAVALEGTTEWRSPSEHVAFAGVQRSVTRSATRLWTAISRVLRRAIWGACAGFAIYEIVTFEQHILRVDSAVQQCVVGIVAVAEMLMAYIVARALDRILAL